MDRRGFVKACVGTAGAAALGSASLGLAMGTVEPRPAPRAPVEYFGAHKVDGPAPRGVPYIPITVQDGVFVGKPSLRRGGEDVDVLAWYRYCGHAQAPGLDPGSTSDNTLTYFLSDEKLHAITPWYKDLLGTPMRPEHFPAAGFGAPFVWRSQGRSGADLLTGLLLRVPRGGIEPPASPKRPARALGEDDLAFLEAEVFHGDFVAVSTFCTHFCCLPTWREDPAARAKGAWDHVFCSCHGSAYDARQPVRYVFAPDA